MTPAGPDDSVGRGLRADEAPEVNTATGGPLDRYEVDSLDGHTMEQLSDYLDRGRHPLDPSIESSAGCRMALAAMERLRSVTDRLLEQDAAGDRRDDERWLSGILESIGREVRSGRDIPVASEHATARLLITEGAVRGLLRSVGDAVSGIVIGRCRLNGEIGTPGATVAVQVDASVLWGVRIVDAVDQVREAMRSALTRHTELEVASIDITVHDVHGLPHHLPTDDPNPSGVAA